MTDLRLADAVDAAEALLQPVRVPRQVVVDHQVGAALQVDALASGIVGDEDAHLGIVVEGGDVGLAHVARHAAMDDGHGLGFADALPDLAREIFERVARLGEDQELAALAGRLVDHRRLVEDFAELAPLGILARLAQSVSKLFEIAQDDQLGFQLGDRLGCRGAIRDLLLGLLQLGAAGLVEVAVFVIVEERGQLLLLSAAGRRAR